MPTIAAHPHDVHSSVISGALPRPRRLDELVQLEHEALAPLYERATLPRLDAIAGDLRGRMLAIPALPRLVSALPRAWARTSAFPWRGKSFAPKSADRGEGINRVVFDRLKLFRFETFVGPSRHDGHPAIQLDYDHAGNPAPIRRVEDEIREIAPGLYLGQAWLRLRDTKKLVLWFALEAR
ncbi:MAG: hypothetical protein M3Y87_27955 [Myxococcota bacterium]|nr:hypothetical protein [Myxococcota bacterium]